MLAKKKYSTSPLAQLRIRSGLSQVEAAAKLGLKHKQNLCTVEIGVRHANPGIMKRMVEVYASTPEEVLEAAIETFERGTTMRKHQQRKVRLLMMRQKVKVPA